MKLLVIDYDGVGLSLALRARDYGHEVKWFVPGGNDVGEGFSGISKIPNWVSYIHGTDFVISTSENHIPKLDTFRSKVPVIAPNAKVQEFCGDAKNDIDGVLIKITGFFGQSAWVGKANVSFAHKKFHVSYFSDEFSRLLGKEDGSTELLTETGYSGPVTVELIIDKFGLFSIRRMTVGFQWPLTNLILGASKKDPVAWLWSLYHGEDASSFTDDIGVYLVLDPGLGTKIDGITRGTQKHVHPVHVQDIDGWTATRRNSIVVTGFGVDIEQASRRAHGTAKKLKMDLEGSTEVLDALHRYGLAAGCQLDLRETRSTAARGGLLPTRRQTLPSRTAHG